MIKENKRRRKNTQGTRDVIDLMRKLKSRDQLLPFRVYLTRATSPSVPDNHLLFDSPGGLSSLALTCIF